MTDVNKWGNCDRCGKPSECSRYYVDVGTGADEPQVCQVCYDEWVVMVERLLNDFMRPSSGGHR